MSKATAIGIDFGTFSTRVAIFRNEKLEIIKNDKGNESTPSVVAFTDTGILVGESAVVKCLKTQATQCSVYEGERALTKQNHVLGCLHLVDIATAPRGVPQIEVAFEVDKDGILSVLEVETATMTGIQFMTEKGGLSKKDIDRLIKEMAQCKL